jgi:hypothetical protein
MKTAFYSVVLALAVTIVHAGCAHSERPVLYPNDHLNKVGNDQAQTDIDECMKIAAEYGADSSSGGKVAKDTAGGALIGGGGSGDGSGARQCRPRVSGRCGRRSCGRSGEGNPRVR